MVYGNEEFATSVDIGVRILDPPCCGHLHVSWFLRFLGLTAIVAQTANARTDLINESAGPFNGLSVPRWIPATTGGISAVRSL